MLTATTAVSEVLTMRGGALAHTAVIIAATPAVKTKGKPMLDLLVCHLAWPITTVLSVGMVARAYVITHNKED